MNSQCKRDEISTLAQLIRPFKGDAVLMVSAVILL